MNTSAPSPHPPSHCPVCAHPAPRTGGDGLGTACPGCGRPPGPGATQNSGELTMRQDVRAAIRADSDGLRQGDTRVLRSLLQHCRGLDRLGLDARERFVDTEQTAVLRAERQARRRPQGAQEAAAARLAAGETDRLLLIETGPLGVSTCTLTATGDGVVVAGPVVDNIREWSDAVPSTGVRGNAELLFLAAGGIGLKGAPPDVETLAAWARELLRPPERGIGEQVTEIILIHRRAHWLLPDLFGAAVRDIAPPVAEFVAEPNVPALADRVQALCEGIPLRRSYHLALASLAEPDGRVSVTTVELFPIGTSVRRGLPVETEVEVARPPGLPGPAALPVLVRGGAPDREWTELTVAHADIPVPGQATVVAALDGPGRVRLQVRGVDADGTPYSQTAGRWSQPWTELAASLPPYYDTAQGADVVVAVELGGSARLVADRLAVLDALSHALRVATGGRRLPAPPGSRSEVRMAAIGYGDHAAIRRGPDEPCQVADFTSPEVLAATVRGWHAQPMVDQFAAPVEDALHHALALRWRRGAQRTLVVVGSRPAGLTTRVGTVVHARVCPSQLDWAEALRKLRAGGVRTLAMVDQPPWIGQRDPAIPVDNTRQMWQDLGTDGQFTLGSAADLRTLADRVVPTPSSRLVLPIRAPGRDRPY